jgi:hypothetical protein
MWICPLIWSARCYPVMLSSDKHCYRMLSSHRPHVILRHQMSSPKVIIRCYHPMLSSDVIIWCIIWCYHPMLSSDVIIWCYHPMLSSDVIIRCKYHPMLSSDVIIRCYHLMLSFDVIIWCYHPIIWCYHPIIWCYHPDVIIRCYYPDVTTWCYHPCHHPMLSTDVITPMLSAEFPYIIGCYHLIPHLMFGV